MAGNGVGRASQLKMTALAYLQKAIPEAGLGVRG
jgi:hypothetical protein